MHEKTMEKDMEKHARMLKTSTHKHINYCQMKLYYIILR